MPRLEEYPFDPCRPVSDVLQLEGLEKLRCVEHEGTRQRLFELYQHVCAPQPINPKHWNGA